MLIPTKDLRAILAADEDIARQSEELFDSLAKHEQQILLTAQKEQSIDAESKAKAQYLWDTGMISAGGKLFSPLFGEYLTKISVAKSLSGEFTKKEHLLFSFLKSHEGELCERDDIIGAVWPEYLELGITDWAIDRLVARVRAKLKTQKSKYKIVTVVTRGYKLIQN